MKNIEKLDKNLPILLVDDYASVRRVVKNCLAKLGFKNIVEAENGSSALDRIAENKFDLVITDWQMPDLKAEELMSRMNVSAANVPFIMLITEAQKKQIAGNKPARTDYMVKPFTLETLEAKLESLFK